MPMPTIPKRTWSLAATGRGEAKSGVGFSSMVFVARDAPAAAAPISRNLRRENLLILMVPRFWSLCNPQIGRILHVANVSEGQHLDRRTAGFYLPASLVHSAGSQQVRTS